MADETTTTTVTELIQPILAEARYTMSQGVFLGDPRFITRVDKPNGKSGVTFPKWDTEAMASVAEGTDLTNTAFDTTAVTITPGEYGLMTTVTDLAELRANENLAISIGRVMGEAYRDAVNQAIWALFDGFSNATGTTNVDITEANIRDAVRELRLRKTPGELFMPCTPHVYDDLLGLYSTADNTTAESIREMALTQGMLPPIYGVTPLLIDNLAAGTSAGQIDAADAKTAIYSRAALGFVSEWDFKIETERDASLRGTELVATASFGVGEINDNYGQELLVDNKD